LAIYTLQTDAGEFKTEFERAQKINAGGAVEQAKAEEPASTAKDPADKDESAEKAKEAAEEKENATGDQEGGKEAGEEAKQ
jgi:single-stranded DNA-specific DHH superfamily exonuclease